jgi:hypothetical protein
MLLFAARATQPAARETVEQRSCSRSPGRLQGVECMLRYFHSHAVLRRAGARSHDFVVAIGFAHPACTSPRDRNSIPRPRRVIAVLAIGSTPPRACKTRCLSTQSVARSPLRGRSNTSRLPGPTPSCRTESHCASPGRIMLYELRLHARPCERERAAWCERRVSVHVAKSGMPL